jgi:hypothetical protein
MNTDTIPDGNSGAVVTRGPRPPIYHRDSIDDYGPNELVEIVRWVNSDGQLRTDEQIIEEMIPMLGFARRGTRIESSLRYAIRHWRLWKK